MKYLWNNIEYIAKSLDSKSVLLLLDYDGTITPIARRPEKAILSQRTKNLLYLLSENHRCHIAIVTGRGYGDIKRLVGLKRIIYAGNHGIEIKGQGILFLFPLTGKYFAALKKIRYMLAKNLSDIEGIVLQYKRYSLSLHYRLVRAENIPLVRKIFKKTVNPDVMNNEIRISTGKMVFEVRPPIEWDKGKASLWLLEKLSHRSAGKIFPIYIGDDKTDEDAFRALKKNGLTIFVGRSASFSANYYIDDTADTIRFLKWLLDRAC